MKLLRVSNSLRALAASAIVVVGSAGATTILPGSETSLQQVICGLYSAGGTSCSQAPDVNAGQYVSDDLWQVDNRAGSLATFVVQIAGLANRTSFGIYDAYNPGTRVALFDGGRGLSSGSQARVSIGADGSIRRNATDTNINFAGNAFGYYLTAGNDTMFSQMALNGGHDQMVAFRGDDDSIMIGHYASGPWSKNKFLLAWEDIRGAGGDRDFNDFVAVVESVSSLPEPATFALLVLSLLSFVVLRRRQPTR